MNYLRLLSILLGIIWAFSINAQAFDISVLDQVQTNFYKLDAVSNADSGKAQKASDALLRSISKHFDLNGVQYTKTDRGTLLINTLVDDGLVPANFLNRFARQVSEKFNGLRFVVDPLKLKKDGATALYVEESKSLYLDLESILRLQTSNNLGHELIHAKFHRLELSGVDHSYLGWLWPSDDYEFMEVGYETGFHFDEIPAYYYQILMLLKELMRAPIDDKQRLAANVAKVLKIASDLSSHFSEQDIVKGVRASLEAKKDIVFDEMDSHHLIQVTSGAYIIVFKLSKSTYDQQDLMIQEVIRRLGILEMKTNTAQRSMELALKFLQQQDYVAAANVMSESKDIVLEP